LNDETTTKEKFIMEWINRIRNWVLWNTINSDRNIYKSESAVMYYSDMSGQPASDAEFDIDSVQIAFKR
jgi:hypothetical protein